MDDLINIIDRYDDPHGIGSIERVEIANPFGIKDTVSHIVINDNTARLIISECMPYITTFSFQLWYKAAQSSTIRFYCGKEYHRIYADGNWQHFTATFKPDQVEDIIIQLTQGEYWFYNTKLEEGYYCTGWRPHSEDIVDSIADTFQVYNNAIKNTDFRVDEAEQAISAKVEQTVYDNEIGIISNEISRINEGYGKWFIQAYDKSKFKGITKEDGTEECGIDIFNKYDDSDPQNIIDNANIMPVEEYTVLDDYSEMLIAPVNRILYYITFAKFIRNTDVTVVFKHDAGRVTLYLNGQVVPVDDISGNVTLEFVTGWNIIEIVCNESNAAFGTPTSDFHISKLPECELFNCLLGIPTSRKSKMTSQYSYMNMTIGKFETRVGESISEMSDGVNTSLRNLETYFDQTINKITFGATQSDERDPSWDDHSELTISPNMISAITRQYEIHGTGPDEEDVTIIRGGMIETNSIKSNFLATDAIKSTNYLWNGNNDNVKIRIKFNQNSGCTINIDYLRIYYVDDRNRVYFISRTGPGSNYSWNDNKWPDIIVPSSKFWVHWHTGSYDSNGIFIIDEIIQDSNATASYFYGPTDDFIEDMPGYNDRIILNNTIPSVNEYKKNRDILWECDYSDIEAPEIITKEKPFSVTGTFLDLANGKFISPSFTVDTENNIAYFSGIISSNEAQLGPWTLNSTSIWKGSNVLGIPGNNNIYIGNDGFSLGDKLIYDSSSGTINMKTSYLSIDGNEFDSAVSNLASGVKLYHSNGVPTSTNYPVNSWDGEYAIHNGDICIDDQTKKVYQFKYIKDNSTPDRVIIKFSSQSGTPVAETGKDYVQIFYKYKGLIYRCPDNSNPYAYSGSTLKNLEVVIPTNEFWLYWHSDGQNTPTTFGEKGFVIAQIQAGNKDRELTPYEVFNVSLPNMNTLINRTLPVGQYPVLENYTTNQDILWKCTPLVLNDTIQWNEVIGYDKTLAMRRINYIDYDAEEGIIVHDGSYIDNANVTGGNVRLKNDGLHIYNGQKEYASYGSTTYFYGYKNNGTQFTGAQINADGFLIGSTNSQYLKWDGSNLTMKVSSLYIGSTDVSSALSNVANGAKTATNYLVYDGTNGLRIYANTGYQDNAYNVQIKGDGMYIRKGGTKLAQYGETTYFYSDGSTVAAQLDKDGLYIQKGSISIGTNFSVDTSGKLICSNSTLLGVFESNNVEGKTIISDAYIRGYKPDGTMTGFLDLQANYTDGRRACVLGADTWELKLQAHTGISFEHVDDRVVWMYLDGAALYLYKNIDMRTNNIINQSDARKKKNIKLVNFNACEMIKKIPVKEFQWKDDNKSIYAGFIAQDVERLETDFLNAGYETIVQEDALGFKAICYDKLIPILWKANQELNEEISSLKQEIQLLKKSNNATSYFVE